MPEPRHIIDQRVREWDVSLSVLSRDLGRNVAWLQQYLRRGTPRVLPDRERRMLAITLDLEERLLGAREPYRPA